MKHDRCEWCGARAQGAVLCWPCESMRVWEATDRITRRIVWTIDVDGFRAGGTGAPSDEQAPIRPVERPKRRASRRAVSGGLCECGHPTKIHDREGLCWHKTNGIEDCDCEAVRPVEVAA
jgi:hypothetical protein